MTNGQKAQQIREKRAKESAGKGGGSQLEANKKAMNVICVICRQPFMCTSKEADLLQHAQNKHGKGTLVKNGCCWALRAFLFKEYSQKN